MPTAPAAGKLVPRKELEALEKRLTAQPEEALKQQQEREELDTEPQTLREQPAEVRAVAQQEPDTHDHSEADTRSKAPSLAHIVRSLVGLDRAAAQAALSQFLNDKSLSPQQIRFVEMVIDQLTARGMMDATALYEPPFSNVHAGGPEELFAGKEGVINAVFQTLESLRPQVEGLVG